MKNLNHFRNNTDKLQFLKINLKIVYSFINFKVL